MSIVVKSVAVSLGNSASIGLIKSFKSLVQKSNDLMMISERNVCVSTEKPNQVPSTSNVVVSEVESPSQSLTKEFQYQSLTGAAKTVFILSKTLNGYETMLSPMKLDHVIPASIVRRPLQPISHPVSLIRKLHESIFLSNLDPQTRRRFVIRNSRSKGY